MADDAQEQDGLGLPPVRTGTGGIPVVRLDHRYEVADRTGFSMGALPFSTLQNLIRQGRLFRTDGVSKDGAALVPLGDLPEFRGVFEDVVPDAFQVGGTSVRPRPELAGALDRVALAGVFARLFQEARTGRLFLVSADRRQEKVVIFRQGVPVNAMSNISEEWLGEMLISQGMITAETFRSAVELRRTNGGRLGSALLSLQALAPRDLHRALTLQAMERLLNAFRQREGSFRFVPDESAADEEILIFAGVRELIEAGLHAALGPGEIAEELAAYGDAAIKVRMEVLGTPWAAQITPADREVLRLVGVGQPLQGVVGHIAGHLRLTTDEARLRLLALLRFGLLTVGQEEVARLEALLARIESQHYFDVLAVGRGASPGEVAEARAARVAEHRLDPSPADTPAVARLREKIRAVVEQAARTLADENERSMYERALQLGIDFEQPEARQRLEFEHHLNRGKTLLAQQKYAEARRAYQRAAEIIPEEPQVYVHLGWSQFLAGNRDQASAREAIREVERGLKISGELDSAYMTLGKIHRLAGDLEQAENNLRRAIEINPHNHEAQSELRLIFARDISGKAPAAARARTGAVEPLRVGVALYVAVVALLFVGSNFIPGGVTEWPDQVLPPSSPLQEFPKAVPEEMQLLGNMEFYFSASDPWWWIRRLVLLGAGLAGIFLVLRNKASEVPWVGSGASWMLAAIPYGLLVGFLSPTRLLAEPLGTVLAMSAVHVLAEQIFFFGFLGRLLLKELREPLQALPLTAVLFGLYQITFLAIFKQPTGWMLTDLLQIGAFAGLAYAFLLWRSGGLLAPFVAHLTISATMMLNSVLRHHF